MAFNDNLGLKGLSRKVLPQWDRVTDDELILNDGPQPVIVKAGQINSYTKDQKTAAKSGSSDDTAVNYVPAAELPAEILNNNNNNVADTGILKNKECFSIMTPIPQKIFPQEDNSSENSSFRIDSSDAANNFESAEAGESTSLLTSNGQPAGATIFNGDDTKAFKSVSHKARSFSTEDRPRSRSPSIGKKFIR